MSDERYKVVLTKQAGKDAKQIGRNELQRTKAYEIIKVCRRNPYEPMSGHCFERLVGNMKGKCSRRIDYGNRFIYEVLPNTEGLRNKDGELYDGIVRVLCMLGHE
jgi:Txe/YoeB family toxin of toxin-antitoxin system